MIGTRSINLRNVAIGLALGVALAAVALFSSAVHAQSRLGGHFLAYAFCIGEDAAKVLTEAVAEAGGEGYVSAMADPNVHCTDTRIHSDGHYVDVEIVGRVWTVTLPDGKEFQFWRVRDATGREDGFIWTPLKKLKA